MSSAVIDALPGEASFPARRLQAYEEARLDGRRKIARLLRSEVEVWIRKELHAESGSGEDVRVWTYEELEYAVSEAVSAESYGIQVRTPG